MKIIIIFVATLLSTSAIAEQGEIIYVPTDSKATYMDIKKVKLKNLAYLSAMRQSKMFGKSATLTFFNCDTKTSKLVIDEDINNRAGLDRFVSKNNKEIEVNNMSRHFLTANDPITHGSITYYKMKHACK